MCVISNIYADDAANNIKTEQHSHNMHILHHSNPFPHYEYVEQIPILAFGIDHKKFWP